MQRHGLKRIGLVIAVCALVGALAGIAGSAAAPSKSSSAAKKAAAKKKAAARKDARALRRGPGGPRFGGPGGPALHSEAVVPNEDGTGFDTVTTDSGTFLSLDGTTVHLKQATEKATYKADAAIDVGSDAKVVRNGEDAKLSDLAKDDHVHIVKAPKGTFVMAASDAWIKSHRGRRLHHHGHGPGPGGPPPGGPGEYPGGAPNQNGSDVAPSTGGGTSS
jgi:hypothetical protein